MVQERKYQICSRCVMDTSDPGIVFDEKGVCNNCKGYFERTARELHYDEKGKRKLREVAQKIAAAGKGREYDCIVGVSGGVDSSFVAYHLKKLGLKPLAIHLDNGWNSELAVGNIERILKQMDIDLCTKVLDWDEFKDLQLSFFKSSLIDCEIPTDHAIMATLYREARRRKIKYIITGSNLVTEAVMPISWARFKIDWRLVRNVQKRFGSKKLKTFPHIDLAGLAYATLVEGIKIFPLLNYVEYDKASAKQMLIDRFGWKDYGGKHYESVYTRFYQGYILPDKFGIDKRRAHFSALICAGQMTRPEALELLKSIPYPSKEMCLRDKEYVIKKFGITPQEFEMIMRDPPRDYNDFPNDYRIYDALRWVVKLGKRIATIN
ncbi:MAG: N-acetyl sugar amidotransferase [Minisyncoccales bacterium]